jgi:hypothetical protein
MSSFGPRNRTPLERVSGRSRHLGDTWGVGDRSGQQLVALHHDVDALAKDFVPEDAQWHAVDQDLSRNQRITFSRVVLPQPEGPVIATRSARDRGPPRDCTASVRRRHVADLLLGDGGLHTATPS